ncbi:MAG: bifunctional [glutamate--ammonia ligase]-adenylyl-L-tyrosine phosphorylase/[glutamate--ammonia-ligase] adenylyltransferase [Desulfuromonadaceae bacterium]|nr:bifunctional [glutamate--ammonia ligase]-adenylyl-L-tyrosine phosphorylase/[glutamate--ammonia-ligase] adenylyltransferase [Desulfuromonadaceae bacterium]
MVHQLQQFVTLLQQASSTQKADLLSVAVVLGFSDGRKTAQNLLDLLEMLPLESGLLTQVIQDALASADPDMAINNLERCVHQLPCETLSAVLQEPSSRRVLLTMLGASTFLTSILCRFPHLAHELFCGGDLLNTKDIKQMRGELEQRLSPDADRELLKKVLRQYKHREVLRIAARDLSGLAALQEVTAELSSLAAASLQVACEHCQHLLQLEYGRPLLDEPDEEGQTEALFTVLGMGKFGGWELNFSSDIDLIYFYSSAQGRTRGGAGGAESCIELHSYFVKLAELLTRTIGRATEDGFVFRVDLNLRPEGRSGELACSLAAAESYYESWGQNWERSAMMKARPVAGSIALGEKVLRALEPFIYRRYLDYGMVEDLKQMKQKIDSSLTRERESENNLKLGRGGIREIEFFIQALQLVFAGKDPLVRERSSLKALQLLAKAGHLSTRDAQTLSDAYVFLRTVEHRIQVVQERQTHSLPTSADELLRLARRSGFADLETFSHTLEQHRQHVMRIYRGLFFAGEEEMGEENSREVRFILNADVDAPADADGVKDLLEAAGFREVDKAFDAFMRLRDGRFGPPMTRRVRRYYDRIVPTLVQELLHSAEPDMALRHLETFLLSLRSHGNFYALLAENLKIIELLISLFATSTLLSRFFTQHPELLDSLVSSSYATSTKTIEEQRADLQLRLQGHEEDYESQLDILRRFRNEEFLRIALNDLQGATLQGSGTLQLSTLAQVCLEVAVSLAQKEMLPRFGLPYGEEGEGAQALAEFAVLGMGKLGGRELNYHSDLDIIFIYSGQGQTRPGPGTDLQRFKPLSNQEYFSRLGQRIISVLTLVTREGRLYEIDTRLRPSGNQGPLVTSLDAYASYHQNQAQLWERQALTKARVVVGSSLMTRRIERINEEITWKKPLPENLEAEIYRLRGRMEKEIARESQQQFNIKTGRGGLVDVEFLTQYLQLRYGEQFPSVRQTNTLQAIQALGKEVLIPQTMVNRLTTGYKFLRRLENKLRLVHDQSISDIATDQASLAKLARLLGYPGKSKRPEDEFYDEYRQVTEGLRALFDQYLGESQRAEN